MRTGIYLQQKELILNLPFKSGVQNLFLKSSSSQSNYSEIERLNKGGNVLVMEHLIDQNSFRIDSGTNNRLADLENRGSILRVYLHKK